MNLHVFQRERYDGVARELAVRWTLRREATRGEAVSRMFTHVFGHELRLEVRGQLVASEIRRDNEAVIGCRERWRAGLDVNREASSAMVGRCPPAGFA